jgi:hypothetical protein
MELLIYLALFYIGFALGKSYMTLKLLRTLKQVADESGVDLDNELEKIKNKKSVNQVHALEVEKINDTFYLFDRINNDFVCQGSSIEELAKLSKDYKNINVATVLHGEKVFMFVNGSSKEYTT